MNANQQSTLDTHLLILDEPVPAAFVAAHVALHLGGFGTYMAPGAEFTPEGSSIPQCPISLYKGNPLEHGEATLLGYVIAPRFGEEEPLLIKSAVFQISANGATSELVQRIRKEISETKS